MSSCIGGELAMSEGEGPMIDHVSIGVRDLERSTQFYDAVLATLGHQRLVSQDNTVGYGKKYPELWLNRRPQRAPASDTGNHVCLRAKSCEAVEAFHSAALAQGGTDHGLPGFRPEYHRQYFAAFVCDPEGNVVEVVTFVEPSTHVA